MTQHRQLARWFAIALIAGTVTVGAVAPAEAVSQHAAASSSHQMRPADTGWNGT